MKIYKKLFCLTITSSLMVLPVFIASCSKSSDSEDTKNLTIQEKDFIDLTKKFKKLEDSFKQTRISISSEDFTYFLQVFNVDKANGEYLIGWLKEYGNLETDIKEIFKISAIEAKTDDNNLKAELKIRISYKENDNDFTWLFDLKEYSKSRSEILLEWYEATYFALISNQENGFYSLSSNDNEIYEEFVSFMVLNPKRRINFTDATELSLISILFDSSSIPTNWIDYMPDDTSFILEKLESANASIFVFSITLNAIINNVNRNYGRFEVHLSLGI